MPLYIAFKVDIIHQRVDISVLCRPKSPMLHWYTASKKNLSLSPSRSPCIPASHRYQGCRQLLLPSVADCPQTPLNVASGLSKLLSFLIFLTQNFFNQFKFHWPNPPTQTRGHQQPFKFLSPFLVILYNSPTIGYDQ